MNFLLEDLIDLPQVSLRNAFREGQTIFLILECKEERVPYFLPTLMDVFAHSDRAWWRTDTPSQLEFSQPWGEGWPIAAWESAAAGNLKLSTNSSQLSAEFELLALSSRKEISRVSSQRSKDWWLSPLCLPANRPSIPICSSKSIHSIA